MINSAAIVDALQAATVDVFATMLEMRAEPGEALEAPSGDAPVDGLVSMIGVTGDWSGMGSLCCPPFLGALVASRMFMSDPPSEEPVVLTDETLDAVSELTNMIIGNAKNVLEDLTGPLAISIPSVIYGRNFRIRSFSEAQWVVLPFDVEGNQLEVKLCLVQSAGNSGKLRTASLAMSD
jgi:chemotaxis protein CheX